MMAVTRRRRFIVVGVAVAVAGGAVLAGRAIADTGSDDSSYRTATVKRASVSQTLSRSGTVEPVAQGTVAFPIAGTVATVPVSAGQPVTTGQTLATLDTTALAATVAQKQAALAAAQLTLANALNGQSSQSSNPNRQTTTTTSAPTDRTNSSNGGGLQAARQAVVDNQRQVDDALGTARVALDGATKACNTATWSSEGSTTTTTQPPRDCVDALQRSLAAQQDVASRQSALAQAQTALDNLLTSASTSSSTASASSSSRSATTSPSSAGSSSGPSSAELVADQAAVDAAQAEVTAGQQALAQGTIVSPLDGTVAAVNMAPGAQVSAGSSTANIVVVGPGGYEVTTTVNVADVGKVKPGQTATVVPDGSSTVLEGKVTSIGVVPTTSGSTTTYPVVIGLTGSPSGLHNGAAASVTIVLNEVSNALTVPTSAVRTLGGGGLHVVTVLAGGKTTNVPVQTGAVGADLTEVRSGLQEGQTVVLADLSQPVPSNNTPNGRNGRNGLGGFGGGGRVGGPTFFGPGG